ncbi:discoidin domain-containing protein [Agaribacter flavus]|uniref:Discoidin domain-containing protein n=1 Tax=Agaribacter flavus TaxID=1902781 RepID=A0ABV7FJY0_9ALTE
MKTFKKLKLSAAVTVAIISLVGCSADEPQPQELPPRAPVATFTSADVMGAAVKGTFASAEVSVTQMNGANVSIASDNLSSANGEINIEIQGDAGFGLDSMMEIMVTAGSGASMICDAPMCGDVAMGEVLSGGALEGTSLRSFTYVGVPYANAADGTQDASFQASALTTVASNLIDNAAAAGRNVGVRELFEAAMLEFSETTLKGLGVFAPGLNVYTTPLISAESYDNFVVGQTCTTGDSGEVCVDDLAPPSVIKASLVNAAFANIAEGETFNEKMANASAAIQAAIDGDTLALEPLRERLLASVSAVPFLSELRLSAEEVVDLELEFIEDGASSGPIKEITTSENVASATITARNRISEGEAEDKAFDGRTDTKWLDHNDFGPAPSAEDPSWIQIEFAESQAVNTIAITSANDAPERDIENFSVSGSFDGLTFVSLGEFIGLSFEERFERQMFTFSNGLAFPIYRIDITKNLGDVGLTQVAEFDFLGPVFADLDHSDVEAKSIVARAFISDGENQDKAFDNDPQTKWLDNAGVPSEEDPAWVQVTFDLPVAVNTLALTSANDAPSRDPENFSLWARNSEEDPWIEIGSVLGESFDERFERKSFSFQNQLAYSIYRVNITKNFGNDSLMQVAEIELIGAEVPGQNQARTEGASYVARAFISDGENQDKAFDGDANTKWLDNAGVPSIEDPSWVQIDLVEAKTVNTLSLTSANDAPERDPENFSVWASNDGGNSWIELAAWIGESFDERFQQRNFVFSNLLPFSTYRFNITKNFGNSNLMQIAEIGLIGPQYAGVDHSSTDGAVYSARASISEGENQDKVFDDDINTKWLDNASVPSVDNPAWVQVDLPSAKVVSALAVTSANDAPDRDPENFELWGSNDGGATWEVIGTWVGESFDSRFQRRSFDVANGFAYTSYRFNVSKNAGNSNLMQIAEIELIGLDN